MFALVAIVCAAGGPPFEAARRGNGTMLPGVPLASTCNSGCIPEHVKLKEGKPDCCTEGHETLKCPRPAHYQCGPAPPTPPPTPPPPSARYVLVIELVTTWYSVAFTEVIPASLPWELLSALLVSELLIELYEHQVDNGTDFNAMDEPSNYAYNTSAIYVAARKDMHAKAFAFFHDFLPPPPVGPSPSPSPSPPPPPGPPVPPGPAKAECAAAGGILSHDSKGTPAIACCAQSCGKCGGKDCPKLPGGKEACCSKEIIADGNSCKTSKAPCVVE
eukprot:gene21143-1575_t